MENEEGQSHRKKRSKIEEIVKEAKSDRISALPDCLLTEIVSRLPYPKDAVNTRKLSKRWKHVWNCIPNLKFKRRDVDYYERTYVPPLPCFFSSVNMFLSQRGQSTINKFELSTSYEPQFESQVNKWIRYAISCNVKDLNLRFFDGGYFDLEPRFVFDQSFYVNSCITDLTLAGCLLDPFEGISWKNLRTLYIKHGIMDDDLMETILSGTPLLETLNLEYCYGYGRLDITSKSLKNLVISGYVFPEYLDSDSDDHVDFVEINAPSILSLKIEEELGLSKILLKDVSSLVKVGLDYETEKGDDGKKVPWHHDWEEEMLERLLLSLTHVNEVNIGYNCCNALYRLKAGGFKRLSNLKVPDVTLPLSSETDLEDLADWAEMGDY
uniref:F-box/LRR-repeat protein 25-like n=1 Tax=Erigeron canadensis TaxID=72917 RepID=UPI001CB93FA8|nr:F-box/LRR-repeat protein 25-like [Erigeron canadensis]XP_043613771.1 F-box/LRR-repeat protein 25-like [Erigeron canadensis]